LKADIVNLESKIFNEWNSASNNNLTSTLNTPTEPIIGIKENEQKEIEINKENINVINNTNLTEKTVVDEKELNLLNSNIVELEKMGFNKDSIKVALEKSKNNFDEAAGILEEEEEKNVSIYTYIYICIYIYIYMFVYMYIHIAIYIYIYMYIYICIYIYIYILKYIRRGRDECKFGYINIIFFLFLEER
jgi:hypothetical protein